MKTATPSRAVSSRANKWVKPLVWLLLALVFVLGAALTQNTNKVSDPGDLQRALPASSGVSSSGVSSSGVSSSGASKVSTVAKGTSLHVQEPVLETKGTLLAGETFNLAAEGSVPKLNDSYGTAAGQKDPINLLPAWRWKSMDLHTNLNWKDVGGKAMSFTASALFGLAGFMWYVILTLLKFGLTLNLVQSTGYVINSGFASLTGSIFASGLFIFILAFGLLIGARMMLKGGGSKIIPLVLAMIIPVALMQTLATNAAKAKDGSFTAQSPKGSPSWLAQTGVGMIDSMGTSLGQGFGTFSSVASLRSEGEEAKDRTTNCYTYTQFLYNQYSAYNQKKVQNVLTEGEEKAIQRGGDAATNAARAAGERSRANLDNFQASESVATVSYLWERSFMGFYKDAQVGDSPKANYAICHIMETQSGVSSTEQAKIAKEIGYPSDGDKGAGKYYDVNGDNQESQWLAWVACKPKDQSGQNWEAQEPWKTAAGMDDGKCKDWWNNGDVDGKMEWNGPDSVKDDLGDGKATGSITVEQLQEARNMALSLKGANASVRLLNSVIAVLTASVYGWALGALAVGAIGAQMGLVLLLILLPATLLLLAIPSEDGKRNPAGRKMLRLTGSFMATKLIITVAVVLLLQTIMTFEAIMSGMFDSQATAMTGGAYTTFGLAGGAGGIMHAVVPLIALFLLKYLLKTAGLGDITKLSGALGMSGAAAMGMGGDANGRGGWNTKSAQKSSTKNNALGDRLKINKADKMLKDRANKVGMWAPKKIGNKGVQAKGTIAAKGKNTKNVIGDGIGRGRKEFNERLQYDNARSQIFGAKDEHGNRVQQGLGGRMRALAAAKTYGALEAANAPGTKAGLWSRQLQSVQEGRTAEALSRNEARTLARQKRGKSREERLQIDGQHNLRQMDAKRAAAQCLVDPERNILERVNRDENGMVIWDENGAQIINSKDGSIRYADRALSPKDTLEEGIAYCKDNDLTEGQIVTSQLGLGSTMVPALKGNSSTAVLVKAKSEEKTKELARDVLQYMPDHLKARRPEWSDDQYNMYLHEMAVAAGGINEVSGVRVDFAAVGGMDLDTEIGMDELRKCLRGEASKFDALQGSVQVSASKVKSIQARVNRLGKGQDSSPAKLTADLRNQDALQGIQEVEAIVEESQAAAVTVQASRKELSSGVKDLEKVVANLKDVQRKQSMAQERIKSIELDMPSSGQEKDARNAQLEKIKQAFENLTFEEDSLNKEREAAEEKTSESITKMLQESSHVMESFISHQRAAKGLDLNFDLQMADKKGKPLASILDQADDFEKQFGSIQLEAQRRFMTAQKVLKDAQAKKDVAEMQQAAKILREITEEAAEQIAESSARSLGNHAKLIKEMEQDTQRAKENALRYGGKTREIPRARDLLQGSEAFK